MTGREATTTSTYFKETQQKHLKKSTPPFLGGRKKIKWNSTYKNSLQWEAERKPMKKDWEIYRDTGILGGYIPEQAKLRRTEDGEVATVFRDTVNTKRKTASQNSARC